MSETCRMPDRPADTVTDEELKDILRGNRTIAIVGLSDKPERDSNIVARFLMERGYRIIPINPSLKEVLGMKSYPDLRSVEEEVHIVDIFRNIEAVPSLVDEALLIGPRVIWLQLGLVHNPSAEKAARAGVKFVQSKCIKKEYTRLLE